MIDWARILDPMRRSRPTGHLPKKADTERRAGPRFPVALPVRYAVLGVPIYMGTGLTIDLSSSGLRLAGDRLPLTGQRIKVYIDWPALLHGFVKLQLVIWGVVVRTHGPEIALQIERHEFRTRSTGQ